jgi:hypothetical protein
MLSGHDGRSKWGSDVGKTLVWPDDGGGVVAFIFIGRLDILGRVCAVVLVRVGG